VWCGSAAQVGPVETRDLDMVPLWCQLSGVEKRKPHHDLAAFKAQF
jgi:hypothetical protein